ncbi:MAG: hypothetical protein ACREJC_00160 [Tepidisphaeraceae bacterium]
MIMMGPTGLGASNFSSDPAFVNCPPNTWFDSAYSGQCIPFGAEQQPAQQQQSSGVPWWQSIITGITQGTVRGLTDDGQPAAGAGTLPTMPMPQAQPWYTTTVGMVGIGVGALALFMLLRK